MKRRKTVEDHAKVQSVNGTSLSKLHRLTSVTFTSFITQIESCMKSNNVNWRSINVVYLFLMHIRLQTIQGQHESYRLIFCSYKLYFIGISSKQKPFNKRHVTLILRIIVWMITIWIKCRKHEEKKIISAEWTWHPSSQMGKRSMKFYSFDVLFKLTII